MLQATEKIWYNGRLIPWDDAKIHVLAHVVSYGSSVFEGIRCYDTEQGSAIFRASDHARRLLDSAKIYRMDLPYSVDQLTAAHDRRDPGQQAPILLYSANYFARIWRRRCSGKEKSH